MRLSANKGDDGYDAYTELVTEHGGFPRVLLDDIEQKWVVIVDTDEGWLERVVTDKDGHIVTDGDEIRSERVHGRLSLIWPDRAGPQSGAA